MKKKIKKSKLAKILKKSKTVKKIKVKGGSR